MKAATPYEHSASWYDTIYLAQGKDYAAEAARVSELVLERVPDASSLLDVGCGTGRHLVEFALRFERTMGVDATEQYVDRARRLGLDARVGDMRDLRVPDPFDVVVSPFSAIGHVRDGDELDMAFASMASCLAPGGVLVVEPWFTPEQWQVGFHGVEVADGEDEILVRANRSGRDGDCSILDLAWTHVSPAGITRLDEQLRLMLFTADRYRSALDRAGLVDVRFEDAGPGVAGRGMWIASRPTD
ncbi:MAG: class I SAM-dependent methyltransferase [Thermoleophilia bacterium]|nr:class I SAM-dependent methyltransferase [Thermoleophilia bacterium]